MTTDKYYKTLIETCLDIGEKRISKIASHPRVAELYGLSGIRTKHFLNSLLTHSQLVYGEFGVYRGSTLVCGLYGNPDVKAYAFDNWHFSAIDAPPIRYKKDDKGNDTPETIPFENVRWTAKDNVEKYCKDNKITFIEKNWLDLKPEDVKEPLDVIHFQPNPGVSEAPMVAYLDAIYPLTAVTSIFIIEAHDQYKVKDTFIDWLNSRKFVIHSQFEKKSGSAADGSAWWGGLGVYVVTRPIVKKDK